MGEKKGKRKGGRTQNSRLSSTAASQLITRPERPRGRLGGTISWDMINGGHVDGGPTYKSLVLSHTQTVPVCDIRYVVCELAPIHKQGRGFLENNLQDYGRNRQGECENAYVEVVNPVGGHAIEVLIACRGD